MGLGLTWGRFRADRCKTHMAVSVIVGPFVGVASRRECYYSGVYIRHSHIYHPTIIPRVEVRTAMQDPYHQQYGKLRWEAWPRMPTVT